MGREGVQILRSQLFQEGGWKELRRETKKDPNLARKASIGGISNGYQKVEKVVFSKTLNLVLKVMRLYILS